jgi:hypothetical protein
MIGYYRRDYIIYVLFWKFLKTKYILSTSSTMRSATSFWTSRDALINASGVDEKETHGALAETSVRLMSSNLKRDICDLRAPGALANEVDSCRVEECLPAELQYACRYWVQHLQRSEIKLLEDGQTHVFLREHLLHWLEALSLMGKASEGVLAITTLESVVDVSALYSISEKASPDLLRRTKIPLCMHLSTMQGDSS